ncbi:hypothetical protein [Halospina denitrificans]|uniref:hypothetical protein n=1 Tax=Halospina denitrificans TaxID=332522 RepID=UPI0010608182|nr:hypothetical protein [Halospina denitrificans]
MTEKTTAKLSSLIGSIFLAILYIVDIGFDGWAYVFAAGTWEGVKLAADTFWGIGFLVLFINLFLMWRDMYREGKWGWFIATVFLFFFSALAYYFIEYRNRNVRDI